MRSWRSRDDILSFLREKRLFDNENLTMVMWRVYGYDVLCLLIFISLWFSAAPDFRAYSSGADTITVWKSDMMAIGAIGLYAPRISIFIAIARHNRMPQTAEWLVTLIGLAFLIFMTVFGGYMIIPYAGSHGYKFCSYDGENYTFAKQALACPAESH